MWDAREKFRKVCRWTVQNRVAADKRQNREKLINQDVERLYKTQRRLQVEEFMELPIEIIQAKYFWYFCTLYYG